MTTLPMQGAWVDPNVTPVYAPDGRKVGVRMHVYAANPRQHPRAWEALRDQLAAAYRTTIDGIQVIGVGDDSQCDIEVIYGWYVAERVQGRKSRIDSSGDWTAPGFDPATGLVQYGVTEDGAPCHVALYQYGVGSFHAWFCGRTRRGKTNAMAGALLSATSAGLVLPVILDMGLKPSLQEWDSVPDAVYMHRDRDAALDALRRVRLELEARGRYMRAERLPVLDPSPQWPVVLVVIDEAPEVAQDTRITGHVSEIARVGAGAGVVAWLATQPAVASEAFGWTHGATIREQLQAGTVLAFSSSTDTLAKVLDGSPAAGKPGLIPSATPGAHMVYGLAHPTPTLAKSWYLRDRGAAIRHVRLPDRSLPDLPAEPVVAATHGAVVVDFQADRQEPADADCVAAVRAYFHSVTPGAVVRTGDVITAVEKWRRSSVYAALAALKAEGVVADGGYGKWRKVA